MSELAPYLEAARPKTLPAAIVPVLVGSAFAQRVGMFKWQPALLCLGFALLVQIGTNFANDYGDFIRGADTAGRIGPRRAVVSGLVSPAAMARAAGITFAAAFALGLGLVWWGGWVLVPVGVASLLFGWCYTSGPFPLAYHGLGDVFVFFFFGLVAVSGTYYVMVGDLPWEVVLGAAPIGLLATNILVVNNYRDLPTDAQAGKRTLVVRYGRVFAMRQYAFSFLVAFVTPVVLGFWWQSVWIALPSVCGLLSIPLVRSLHAESDGAKLNALLAKTALLLLAFGVCWSAALVYG